MRIFVGGLPRTATKEEVVKLFRQFGASDETVVLPRDRRTRRRKGVAYVDLPDEERGRAAIAVLSGIEIDGKPLTVCAAEDRPLKKGRGRRAFTVVLALFGAFTGAFASANADSSTDIGLTLNPLIGTHESFNDRQHVPPVPAPLLDVRQRSGPFELEVEGLPDIVAADSYDPIEGHTSTHLAVFYGTFRAFDPSHRFSAGIGEVLYAQNTHYSDGVEIAGVGERQFSRIVGANYELGFRAPASARDGFEARFAYAPALTGNQYTNFDVGSIRGRVNPERGEQIDTYARYVRRITRRGHALIGLRYLSYVTHYANGGLADRNVGFLPEFGYRWSF
jgi:hypothetical protein